MEKLNKLLLPSLAKKGLARQAVSAQICHYALEWSKNGIKPISFNKGVLKIGTTSSSQASEFQMRQDELIDYIDKKIGKKVVRAVRFVLINGPDLENHSMMEQMEVNMLEVKIENIIPVTEARDSFNKIVDEVEGSDQLYVLTKNGKPAAVIVGVHHLEKLTGTSHEELIDEDQEVSDFNSKEVLMPDDMNSQTPAQVQPTDLNNASNQDITNTPAETVPAPTEPMMPVENAAPVAPAVESADTSVNEPMSFTPAPSDTNLAPAAAELPVEQPVMPEAGVVADSPVNEPLEEVPVTPVPGPDAPQEDADQDQMPVQQ